MTAATSKAQLHQQAIDAYQQHFGAQPRAHAVMPGSIAWLGDFGGNPGGTALVAAIDRYAAVAVGDVDSSAGDVPKSRSHARRYDTAAAAELLTGRISFLAPNGTDFPFTADSQAHTGDDDAYTPESVAASLPTVWVHAVDDYVESDELATLLLATIAYLQHKQLLARALPSVALTVVGTIPRNEGCGATMSIVTGLIASLVGWFSGSEERLSPPAIADFACRVLTDWPVTERQWWRGTAALRATEGELLTVNHSDGGITPLIPTDERRQLEAFLLCSTINDTGGSAGDDTDDTGDTGDNRDDFETRSTELDNFVAQACRAHGVTTLRELPQAPTRVLSWLDVMRERNPEGYPAAPDATAWLQWCGRDSARAKQVIDDLRSRRAGSITHTFVTSSHDMDTLLGPLTKEHREGMNLCQQWEPLAVRPLVGSRSAIAILADHDCAEMMRSAVSSADSLPQGWQLVPLDIVGGGDVNC